MTHRSLDFYFAAAPNLEKQPDTQAFVPYPAFLLAGLSPQQRLWQQQVYLQAWREAQAALSRVRPIRVRLADLPSYLRN